MLTARIFSLSSLLESVSACMDGATQLPQRVSFTLSRFMRPCGVTEGLVVLGHCIREWLVYYKVYFLYSVSQGLPWASHISPFDKAKIIESKVFISNTSPGI